MNNFFKKLRPWLKYLKVVPTLIGRAFPKTAIFFQFLPEIVDLLDQLYSQMQDWGKPKTKNQFRRYVAEFKKADLEGRLNALRNIEEIVIADQFDPNREHLPNDAKSKKTD